MPGSGSRREGRSYDGWIFPGTSFCQVELTRFGCFENIYIFVSSNNQSYFLTAKIF
jgi:hypothetical protein